MSVFVVGESGPDWATRIIAKFQALQGFDIDDYGGSSSSPDNRAAIDDAITDCVAAGGGHIWMAGTRTVASADTNGNAVTLPVGVSMRGPGMVLAKLKITCAVTWGVQVQGAESSVSDITVETSGSGTATYGVGVDTPTAVGSAESTRFSDILVHPVDTGTVTNCFAVGPTHVGVGTVDIANTQFRGCIANLYSNAGWIIGNTTSGNILDTHMDECAAVSAVGGLYGVQNQASAFTWSGGSVGKNTVADFYLEGGETGPVVIENVRSEGSASLLKTTGVGAVFQTTLRGVAWNGNALGSTGIVINYNFGGTLNIDGLWLIGTGTVTPLAILGAASTTGLTVNATGIQSSAVAYQFFSAGSAAKVAAVLTAYTQLSATGGDPFVAFVPGPIRLGPSSATVSYNGTNRGSLHPVEKQTLASNGAVTFGGICEIAEIKLQANASSSTIAAAYPGQVFTIEWLQDSTGSRTYVWPTNCSFAAGAAPTPSTTANYRDSVTFRYSATLSQWLEISRAVGVH